MRIATPAFFCFSFAWNIFFHPLTFSLYVSLGLKWVSCRQHIYRSYFCIHSVSLCLLLLLLSRVSCVRLLWDPIDGNPSGSSVPGVLQARILEWVAISFSNACTHAKWLQSYLTVRPHGQQPTRLPCPQDSPDKNTLEWVAISFSILTL